MLEALAEFVRGLTTAEELEALREDRTVFLPPAVGAELAGLLAAEDPAELTANVVSLRNLMPAGDLFHTALLALFCGTLVERGADAGAAIDATLELFVRQLDALADKRNRDDGTVAEMVSAAGNLTFMATTTMLARSVQTRKRWHARPEVMERLDELEEDGLAPWFLRELFTLHDDEDLLVLDPQGRRAFQFRMTGVRDRLYHCYALLQDALLRHTGPGYLEADPVDPDAVRYAANRGIAEGEDRQYHGLSDRQRFTFTVPGMLFMPGSASPRTLPTLDGLPFLLVEPMGLPFTWEPANMYGIVHEALKASVELVREFDPDEAESLLAKCGA